MKLPLKASTKLMISQTACRLDHLKCRSLLTAVILFLFTTPLFSQQIDELRQALTFYASFNDGFDADLAVGDPILYTAPEWSRRASDSKRVDESDNLRLEPVQGVVGDALYINNADQPVYFFRGEENITYETGNWEGAVSFWLRLSPDEDLAEGYSDPLLLTDSAWDDGALYVDFTYNVPRSFRFAFFSERDIWNPEGRDWEEIPVDDRPMIEIENHPFKREEWVHITFTFRNFNSGEANGEAIGYLNGEYAGKLEGIEQTIQWIPGLSAIWLGYNYNGYMDELAIFNRALSADEVRFIYENQQSFSEVLSQ